MNYIMCQARLFKSYPRLVYTSQIYVTTNSTSLRSNIVIVLVLIKCKHTVHVAEEVVTVTNGFAAE